jgi:hypothetical protein
MLDAIIQGRHFSIGSRTAAPLRVLAAGTRPAVAEVRAAVADVAHVTAAFTMEEALCRVTTQIDVVACNVRFDQSRMFDFLHALGEFAFRPPVICFRALQPPPLSATLRRAIGDAATALGAHGFIDLDEVARTEGLQAARKVLRCALTQCALGGLREPAPRSR